MTNVITARGHSRVSSIVTSVTNRTGGRIKVKAGSPGLLAGWGGLNSKIRS